MVKDKILYHYGVRKQYVADLVVLVLYFLYFIRVLPDDGIDSIRTDFGVLLDLMSSALISAIPVL